MRLITNRSILSIAFGLAAFAALALAANPAHAGALSYLTYEGNTDDLTDDDWESLLDRGTTPDQLDVGDLLYGVFRITNYNGTSKNNTDPLLVGVFALRVESITFTGSTGGFDPKDSYDVTFGAPTVADWSALQGVLSNWPGRNSTDTVLIVFDDPNGLADPGAGDTENDVVADASNGTLVAEAGFSSPDAAWIATVLVSDTSPGADPIRFDTLRNLDFIAALDVTHNAVPGIVWLDVTDRIPLLPDKPVKLSGGVDTIPGPPFDARTNTTVHVNPTPEPATLALFSIAGVSGILVTRRRRNS